MAIAFVAYASLGKFVKKKSSDWSSPNQTKQILIGGPIGFHLDPHPFYTRIYIQYPNWCKQHFRHKDSVVAVERIHHFRRVYTYFRPINIRLFGDFSIEVISGGHTGSNRAQKFILNLRVTEPTAKTMSTRPFLLFMIGTSHEKTYSWLFMNLKSEIQDRISTNLRIQDFLIIQIHIKDYSVPST